MSSDEQELHTLIDSLHRGEITEEQHERLGQLLVQSEVARRVYYDRVDVDLLLTQKFASRDPILEPATQRASFTGRVFGIPFGLLSHVAAVAATVVVLAAVQRVVVGTPDTSNEKSAGLQSESYIATLTRSMDCDWGGQRRPRFDGQRLLTDELHLTSGLAEFSFDTGVRLLMEGPARLRIESAKSAVLSHGRVVLHGSEAGEPFLLRTPTAELVDIGTEYGASVSPEGSTEVHVFEGEVAVEMASERTSKQTPASTRLTEGQASLFSVASVQIIGFDASQFVRQMPTRHPSGDVDQDILAYEGFDYPPRPIGNASGGVGWRGGWRKFIRDTQPSQNEVVADSVLGKGHSLRASGRPNVSWRTLKTPVRLDADASYYVSFLTRKRTAAPGGVSQYGSLSLCSSDYPEHNHQLSFGMSSDANLILNHNDQQILSAPPMPFDETVLVVAKIVAGKDDPDQVMVRWYGPLEDVSIVEPHTWAAVSYPSFSDAEYSELSIRSGGDIEYLFDEIRITSSWLSAIEGVALASQRMATAW